MLLLIVLAFHNLNAEIKRANKPLPNLVHSISTSIHDTNDACGSEGVMCEHGHVKKYRHVLEASQSQLSTHSPHSQLHLGIHMTTLAFAWNPDVQQMRHEVVHKQHHSAPLPATRLNLATALDRRPSRTPNKPLEPPLQSGHSITRNQVSATINSKKHQQTNKHKSHQPQCVTSHPTASPTATAA
jgi:hypothetical protein